MDLLALEPLLIARLESQLGAQALAGVTVRPLRTVAEIASRPVPTPALLVSYAGGEVLESRHDAQAARIAERWLITAVVRNVANANDSAAAAEAGPLAGAALEALMGWQPPGTSQPLTLSGLPAPGFGGGYLWVPLEFATQIVRRVSG